MNRIVINEMRAWRKRLTQLGVEARIVGRTAKTWKGYKFAAVAYNPDLKRDFYLLVREG